MFYHARSNKKLIKTNKKVINFVYLRISAANIRHTTKYTQLSAGSVVIISVFFPLSCQKPYVTYKIYPPLVRTFPYLNIGKYPLVMLCIKFCFVYFQF